MLSVPWHVSFPVTFDEKTILPVPGICCHQGPLRNSSPQNRQMQIDMWIWPMLCQIDIHHLVRKGCNRYFIGHAKQWSGLVLVEVTCSMGFASWHRSFSCRTAAHNGASRCWNWHPVECSMRSNVQGNQASNVWGRQYIVHVTGLRGALEIGCSIQLR